MNISVFLSPDELAVAAQFKAWGWLKIPDDVVLVPDPVVVAVPIPPIHVFPATPDANASRFLYPGQGISVIGVPLTPSGFETAFKFVCGDGVKDFGWEGEYTNDPSDPGGPTKYGIDTRDDKVFWSAMGVESVKDLTFAQAKQIYLTQYWDKCLCGQMPPPIDLVHFNFCVNEGSEASVKFMQEALALSVQDGQFGPSTQAALAAATDHKAIALAMIGNSDARYKELSAQPRFTKDLKGWLNRDAALRKLVGGVA